MRISYINKTKMKKKGSDVLLFLPIVTGKIPLVPEGLSKYKEKLQLGI